MKKLFTSCFLLFSTFISNTITAQTWTNVTGLGNVSKVSCGSATQVVALATAGSVNAYRLNTTTNMWASINGGLKEVSVASSGTIWGLAPNGTSYYRTATGTSWVNPANNVFSKITTNSTSTYAGTSTQIRRFNAGWFLIGGNGANELSIGDDNTLMATAGGTVYKYTLATDSWATFSARQMDKIAVRNASQILGLRGNSLYYYDNGAWSAEASALRTDVRDMAVASDGTIYIATTASGDNNVFKSTWSLITQPPTSIKSSEFEAIQFNTFPNPSKGLVNLALDENIVSQKASYTVSNVLGQEIMTGNISEVNTSFTLPKGFYFVSVQTREGLGVQKVVVE